MVTFSSNSQQAQQSTSRITSATTPLNQASSLQNDTRTTLIGNQDIQSSITSAKNSANQIASAISGDANRLQTVAQGFSTLDTQLSRDLFKERR
ncbi:MAG: TIGR04197 family type VII secretion effector [Enterococcus faecium]|uniref:TIGR04197 family type VII secretion effector n=1 Tax=Enterococcus mundtii TaxID=53346 RepID=A0A2T5DEN6_ENTMU|nr:TIGR04197 family type VII secretion effector [Enterococcus mundtii]MBE6171216.1 TIGR04197 family type VII secretion effector [Enterococcus faecium]PTO36477.1 TIGR04197 family type VII secretion effector [Enterococcus mundtii]